VVWWEEHGKDGEYFTGKAVLAGMDGPGNGTVAEDELGEGLGRVSAKCRGGRM